MANFTRLAVSLLSVFCLFSRNFCVSAADTSIPYMPTTESYSTREFPNIDYLSTDDDSSEEPPLIQPHIILIIGDDIGWNDVGWHNPTMYTPFMNSLASDGVILNNYYSFPQCTPSRASILTGIYANRLGLQRGVLTNEEPYGVPLSFSMLPQHLRDAGYQTHAMGKWHVGYCNKFYTPPFRGFDSYLGYYNGAEENFLHCVSDAYVYTKETCNGFDFHNSTRKAPQYYGQFSTQVQTQRAIDIIHNYDGVKPLFLYISITNMHFPVQSEPQYLAKCVNNVNGARTNFCGAMAALDEGVQNITKALKANDMWENTILVFVSDNGAHPSFGGNNYPLRGIKSTQWEGGSRVPAFVHSPLLKGRNYINKELIHVTDWYPTFLKLAGAKKVDGIDGVDQWSTISENKPSNREDLPYLFDQGKGTLIAAIRDATYKLMVGPGGNQDEVIPESQTTDQSYNLTFLEEYVDFELVPFNLSDRSIRLFNLQDDPSENNDISALHPTVVNRLMQRLMEYQRNVKPAVKMADDPAGKPSNFGGWYMPGWCNAMIKVPDYATESTNHLNFFAN